ncbi:hypothetical protein, partial [Falsiroseomonas oryzae]|uniref:hypothetical protein n=1 Tax=Falsiroseomonas oryzae TaxID=2766473 RepID=UPI0022EADC38
MPDVPAPDAWLEADIAGILGPLCGSDPATLMVADDEGAALDRAGFWRIACGVSHAAAAAPAAGFALLPPTGAAAMAWIAG